MICEYIEAKDVGLAEFFEEVEFDKLAPIAQRRLTLTRAYLTLSLR